MQAAADLPLVRRSVVAARLTFALAGACVALGGTALLAPPYERYAVAFVLLALTHFACIDMPPPIKVMALPHIALTAAFTYIIGLPVVTVDYVAKLVTFAAMVWLHRHGLVEPPAYLRPMVEAWSEHRPVPPGEWIDHWATHANAALGCVVRWVVFSRIQAAGVHPTFAILAAELSALATLGLINLVVPLPTAEWLRARATLSEPVLNARVDVIFATALFQPPLVFLVYYAYREHVVPGALGWSFAAFGLHYVLRLLNDRRASLVRQNDALIDQTARLDEANRELEEKARALQEKQDQLRDFVYTVTHDLKNPLGAIQITADLLRESDGTSLSREGRDHVQRIIRLASATDEMIRDLMQFFRVTSTRETAGWVSLDALVQRALDSLQPQVVAKSIAVEVDALPRVFGEREKLQHVVANVLSNAIKYVPRQCGRVRLSAVAANGRVRLCVQDNGIGISPAYHEGIFELFARVPGKEQTVEGELVAGSGVGLAIVKRIVEAHNGRVWVESAPGAGSRFFVELPAAPPR